MDPHQALTPVKDIELHALLAEGVMRLCQGDFSYRVPRNMQRDAEDAAAFFVNAIAGELEQVLFTTRRQELRLTEIIENLTQALTCFASGDFSVQVPRDFSGDAADVLAFMVNTTILELGALVVESQRRAEEDIHRLKHLVEERTAELRIFATTDSLTGTLNRHRFFELAEEECARCRRYNRSLTVAMLDLDHFKEINDCHGHSVGDDALRLTADAIRRVLRKQDHICRYGGEEFVVLMPETGVKEGLEVFERVRGEIARIDLPAGAEAVSVRASIGVTEWHPPESIERVIQRADATLYQAKAAGRDRVFITP